jgi:hypothetical protein
MSPAWRLSILMGQCFIFLFGSASGGRAGRPSNVLDSSVLEAERLLVQLSAPLRESLCSSPEVEQPGYHSP